MLDADQGHGVYIIGMHGVKLLVSHSSPHYLILHQISIYVVKSQHLELSLHFIIMDVAYLVARRLRHNDDGNSTDNACPPEPHSLPADQIKPIIGSLTFHNFASILSGACGLASLLIVSIAILRHATNFSNPVQQRQVIRILMLVPWVALFSFLIVWQENVGEYLVESLDFGCSIAISAFLLLLCDYVLSNNGGFDDLFGPGASKIARDGQIVESPKWLKVRTIPLHASSLVLELTYCSENMVHGSAILPRFHHRLDCNCYLTGNRHLLRCLQQAKVCTHLAPGDQDSIHCHCGDRLFPLP